MNDQFLSLLTTQTWQIAVLAMIVAVIVKIAAKNRPHLAHALWILVLIKCVTPPLWGHSLGVFSQVQNLIGHDAEVSTVDPESIVAITVLPSEVSLTQEPDFVEHTLESITESPSPQEAIAIAAGSAEKQLDVATIQESLIDQKFASDDSIAQSANVSWPTILLWTVAIGAISTLLITMVRCVRALRLIYQHRTTEFDDALNERLQQLATQLRIRCVPRIVVSDVLFGPAVLGLFRHTIVLPRCLFERLTLGERSDVSRPINQRSPPWNKQTSEDSRPAARRCVTIEGKDDLDFLDPILAHELLHIRRGDLGFGMLQVIAQSLWWFHPAVWFSNRWLSREAERCCDEQVIAELGCSPGQYARSLLAVIESKHALQPIPVFPGMKPVEITTQRMERIMSLKTGLNKRTPLWCWLAVASLAIIVLPGAVANSLPEEVAQTVEPKVADDKAIPPTASGQSEASDETQFRATQNNPPSATAVGISNSKPIGSRFADAVSPELEQIISDWTAASAKTDHLQGTVLRRVYDEVHETESVSHGKFRFESTQNWSINFAPVEITEVMKEQREQGTIPSKTGRNGRPFRLISSEAEAWTRENRNLVEMNGKDRSTHTLELPADYQGGALIDRLLPIPLFTGPHTLVWSWNANPNETFSSLPGDSGVAGSLESQVKLLKQRFDISLLRPTRLENKKVYLQILPRLTQDAGMWSSIQLVLDLQTNLPSAVRIEDPAGTKTTVYLFSGLSVNSIVCEFSSILPQGLVGAPVDTANDEKAALHTPFSSTKIEIAEEPLPGNRPDRVQSIYDASKLITRMAKESSVDRTTAGESVRALVERWLNSAGDSRAALVSPWKVTLDEERLVNISPRKQSLHFIETVSLFEKHGFEAFLVEVQAFELPKPTAESILDATTVVSPVEATPASPSGTATASLAAATKSNNSVRNKIEVDRRIRTMLMSDDQLQAMRAKATDGLVANALQSPMVVVHDGQVTHYRNLRSVEILANVGLDVSVERREQSLFSVKCTVETPVNEHYRGETTTIQTSVALADKKWLVFESVTKTNPDGTVHSGLIAVRAACVAPANIPQQSEIISRRGNENVPSEFTVNVSGAVRVPGIYVFDADKDWTLLDALRLAGGLSDDAGKTITVKPKNDAGNAVLIQLDLIDVAKDIDSNILVGPGDVIVVERAENDAAEAKPKAAETPVFLMILYPVADLVVPIPRTIEASVTRRETTNEEAAKEIPAAPEALTVPQPAPRETRRVYAPADFAPLVELIKASVEPESWGSNGSIVADTSSTALVIRQTQKAHDEIIELVSKLRNANDQNVQITSRLMQITTDEQLKSLTSQCSLHPLDDGKQWALLTPNRSEALSNALREQKVESLFAPRVMTISGQSARIERDSNDHGEFTSFCLSVTPQLIPDSSVIRLHHAVSIGREVQHYKRLTYESLVGSGQTLLLLIEQPRPDDAAKSMDRYVMMMTPEHVVEAVGKVDGGKVETDSASTVPGVRDK